jgi:hypothetical protein
MNGDGGAKTHYQGGNPPMEYQDIREQFENLTSSERLEKLNLMWPSLAMEIQMCVLLLITAILGPEDVAALSHTIVMLSDN